MRSTDLPNQYQTAGFAADGSLVHAGVHGAARLSRKALLKAHRKWAAWKEGRIRDGAKPCKPVVRSIMYSVDHLPRDGGAYVEVEAR